MRYDLFKSKKLLIVAGPTGCGKSTFLRSALGSNHSPLTKKILEEAFKNSNVKIEQLYLRRLRKRHERQSGFEKFINEHDNFILDVDTTGPGFKRNAKIFPNFLMQFNHVISIQIYTPYEVWLNRILKRKINSSLKGSKTIRQILYKSFSLKARERNQAKKIYCEHYNRWELYLEKYNLKSQYRISTIQDSILE